MCKLLGYRKFNGKTNGKPYCTVDIMSAYSDREQTRGAVGSKVETVFLPDKCVDMLKPTDIGKELDFSYDVSGGKAYLIDVKVR